ncbi:Sulfate/thiosulfate import ATP-binding protein CysA [Paraconexibacter sp. AEG42_29]|uniref:ABC-type quaternary amine transporter n=1 Tax=Paraconexibacter sp. AEG42_29 TaxID=2997339 RepID=A0AAU7AZ83_9ACTN
MSAELAVEDAWVTLGGTPVLRGLSLGVASGTRSALVGPSGAGKTTLLRAVAGLTRLDAGTVRLGGRVMDGTPAHTRGVAVVFQEPRLLPHLDVAENVALPLRASGTSKRERRQRADELLGEVGLGALARRPVAGLSGGEQQRVALARALCADPQLLLLDEPLAALDPNRRDELRALLVALQQERRVTMLVVTHDRAEAAELGDRVALLMDGRIVQEGEPRALFERPASVAAARFLGMSNLIASTVRDGRAVVGGVPFDCPGPDGPATLAIRPEHVRLGGDGPLRATVLEAVYTGTAVRVLLSAAGALELTVTVPTDVAPRAGEVVRVDLPPRSLWRIPGEADPS